MIRSMTAYASAESGGPAGALSCELRTVNHRYLELSPRLPDELRSLESALDPVGSALAESEQRYERLDLPRADQERMLDEHRTALAAIQSSTSWRVTRPMRAIVRLLRA